MTTNYKNIKFGHLKICRFKKPKNIGLSNVFLRFFEAIFQPSTALHSTQEISFNDNQRHRDFADHFNKLPNSYSVASYMISFVFS